MVNVRDKKALLSNPPWLTQGGKRWGIRAGSRWPFTAPAGGCYYPYPFLLGYATSFLRNQGIEAYLVDSILIRESVKSYLERLQQISFDYLVIETSSPSIDYDLELAEEAAKYTKVVLTGPHATVFAEELMNRGYIFAIIKGEYEKGLSRLLETNQGGIYDYNLVDDLDSLPFPYRDSTIYRYNDRFPNSPPGPILQLWGSRGCPYRCIFCLWPPVMYNNRYRARKPEAMIKEIEETFQEYPRFTSVYFDDDTFNIGQDRILDICSGLRDLGIPWAAMCRADTVDIDTFRAMRDSGCYAVKFGIESGCQELVNRCHKRLDLKVVEEVVREVKKMGIFVHVTFTWGLPGESLETIERTREFYRRLQPDSVQQSCCTPFPGTPYYEMLARTGQLDNIKWESLDGNRLSVINTENLTPEELMQYAYLE